MGDTPEVTVVIPTRDRRELLTRTLASALAQRGVALEVIIVVDDDATDGTEQWVARLGEPRVTVVSQPAGGGLPGARNAGIAAARGAWLAFLDDDDLWAPDKLARQIAAADTAAAGFTYGAALHVGPHLGVHHLEPAPEPEWLIRALRSFNPIPAGASNVLARTELVRTVGGFDESLRHLADWDLWLCLTASAQPVACPQALVAYVQHAGSQRRVLPSVIAREHRVLVAKHGLSARDPEGIWFWRWVAGGHLAAGHSGAAALELARAALRFRSAPDLREAARLLAGGARRGADPTAPPAPDWLRAQGAG